MPVRIYDPANPSDVAPVVYTTRSWSATNVAYKIALVNVSSAFAIEGYSEVDALVEEFNGLANEWHDETAHLSSTHQIAMHHAYQRIIGMGDPAVPLILNDLRTRGGHWFWALGAITNASPGHTPGDLLEARDAWIDWGKRRGYLVV
jgi:hypothetical protein